MSSFGGRPVREPFVERHHFLTFVVLAAAGLGLTTLGVKQPERIAWAHDLGLRVTGPIASVGSGASGAAETGWQAISSTWKARRELEQARTELDALRLELAQRTELASENESLRQALDLKKNVQLQTVAARVVYQERSPDWVLVIDRGAKDGIAEDQAVMAPQGVVGKVLSVSPTLARVQCLMDGDAGIAALVGDDRRQVDAIVTDGDGQRARLRHMELMQDLHEGDRVVTSGLDLIYPRGLLVGTVESVEIVGGLEQEITVRPAVDFTRLEHVLVIVTPGDAGAAARADKVPGSERRGP